MFANVISIVDYVGMMSEVDIIAQHAVTGDEMLRHKPVDFDYKEKQIQCRQCLILSR